MLKKLTSSKHTHWARYFTLVDQKNWNPQSTVRWRRITHTQHPARLLLTNVMMGPGKWDRCWRATRNSLRVVTTQSKVILPNLPCFTGFGWIICRDLISKDGKACRLSEKGSLVKWRVDPDPKPDPTANQSFQQTSPCSRYTKSI